MTTKRSLEKNIQVLQKDERRILRAHDVFIQSYIERNRTRKKLEDKAEDFSEIPDIYIRLFLQKFSPKMVIVDHDFSQIPLSRVTKHISWIKKST